jgi:hypothetical protein
MRATKRSLSILVFAVALSVSSQAGQLHGQPITEVQQYDVANYWRQVWNFFWPEMTIQYIASFRGL